MQRLSSLCLGMAVKYFLILFAQEVTAQTVSICERTPQVQQEILRNIPNHDDCATVTAAQLLSVRVSLDLTEKGISSLKEGDFGGLSRLKYIYLYDNELTVLPADLFAGLDSLLLLSLSQNSLTSLPVDIFDGLSQLEELYLYENAFGSLDPNLLNGLSNLWLLDLSEMELNTVPEDLLDGIADLRILIFRSNNLRTLPEDIFDEIEGPMNVYLAENLIDCLPKTILDLRDAGTIRLFPDEKFKACPFPLVTLDLSSPIIPESGGQTSVTAKLDKVSKAETKIKVSVAPNSPDHFTLVSSDSTLTIAAGATTSTGDVSIMVLDNENEVDEPDKIFEVQGVAENTRGVDGPETVRLTIADNDDATKITLSVDPSRISEDAENVEVTVTATMDTPRSEDTQVTVTVEDGTAVEGFDYLEVSSFEVMILANATTATRTFTFTSIPDEVDEHDETVRVTGTTPVEGLQVIEAALTLTDEDIMPEVTLDLTPSIIKEDGGISTVKATLNRASSAETTIELSVDPDSPDEYTLSSPLLTIAPGASTSNRVRITAVDDNVEGPPQTFQVTGIAENEVGVTGPLPQTLTITDDDKATAITLAVSPSEVNEDAGSSEVMVTALLDAARSTDTQVTILVEDGTAVAGTDYVEVSSFDMAIPANVVQGTGQFTFTPTPDEIHEGDETVRVMGMTSVDGVEVSEATLTLGDAESVPVVTLELSGKTIDEDGGITTVTAMLDDASSAETTVEVVVSPDSPATSDDFNLSTMRTLTIAAGATTSTGFVTITAVDNAVDGPEKTVQVGGTAENLLGVTGPSPVELVITNDDEATGITLAVSPSEVSEDEERTEVVVTATLDTPRSTDTEVTVTVGDGTAVAGTDYVAVSSFDLTILANQAEGSGRFTFTPTPDDMDEPDETVRVTGTAPVAGVQVGQAILKLTDVDPTPFVTLELTPETIEEDGGQSKVTATLSGLSSTETTIEVSVTPDSPATHGDYDLSSTPTLTIAPGAMTSTEEVTITAVDNAVDAPEKTFQVRGRAENPLGITNPLPKLLTITDDEESTGITLAVFPFEVDEDAGSTQVTVTAMLDSPRNENTEVTVMVGDGTATSGEDFEAVEDITLIILANATEGSREFTFQPIQDGIDEPNETVLITGSSSLGAGTQEIFTLEDVDPTPAATLMLSPESIGEDDGQTTVTATLSGPSSEATTIEVSVVPDSPEDYTLSPNRRLWIPRGETASERQVTITAVDNAVDGPDKTFQVRGRAENPLGITSPSPVELTITDDDEATAITLAVSPSEVNEDAGRTEVAVTATLDAARSTDTEVTVTVDGGTATLGIDFAPVASFRLIILANQTSGIGAFELSPVDDSRPESSETVRITASTPELGTATTLVTIRDNDEVITLSIRDQMVPENVGEARVLVDVTPAAPTDLSVDYRTVAGTATEGEDYASSPGTLPISAGSRTASIAVSIVDDSDVESGETFRVELFDPSQGAVLDRAVATVTIEDDDLPRLQVGDASASEGDLELTFVVTLDAANPTDTVQVEYETLAGTAQPNIDYTPREDILVFPPGEDRREVSVPIVDDDEVEDLEETFRFRLFNAVHARLPTNAVATGTIEDNDMLPRVNIQPVVTAREDAGQAPFEVRLSHPYDTVVEFIVIPGTAEASRDYEIPDPHPLRFSGQTTLPINVAIIDDEIYEGDETFRVELIEVHNGISVQFVGMGTIVDNEAPVTVSIEDVTVSESEQEAVFPVTLSGEAGMELEFSYAVEDETAEAGQDYASAAGTVTFASGELRQQIQISILDDQETEPTETFRVRLSGDNILDGEGRGTILDDDAPLTVGIGDGEASEGAGSLALRVWLNRASSRVVTVQFASSDSTATSSADYAASRGMIIFEPGSTEGQIRIQVVEDEEIEPAETFQVALSNARHATIARGTGTGTILDNDGITSVSVQGGTVSRRVATFEVRLSAASSLPVLVSYASEDGSAKAGQDYAPSAGQITFTPGEVSKAVEVKLLSNGPSWQAKTFSLVLLSAVNAELREVQAEAVVEEEIEENVLDAYVSRVVRTWASHVVEALSRRTEGLSPCRLPSLSWLRYGRWRPSVGELFGGCGAMVTQGGWSVWGQGAFTRLRGMDGALSLRSDVTTMLVGADHVWSRGWMAGVLAAHSLSSGAYAVPTQSGSASSRLTGVYPYVSYQTGAGMRAWLLVGLGRGEAEVDALESEVGAGLVALGASGTLVGGTTGRLGYEADVLMAAAEVEESGSRLWVRRMRTGVEGSLRWGPGLQPYVEAALRHDSGDAETGLGVELGGGLRWSTSRLRAELGGRTLVLHTAEGLREWGLMAGLKYGDPGEMGPTMQVRPIWGNVYGGDLWREAPLESMGQGIGDRRLEVELGYGTWLRESLGRSVAGMTLDPRGRTYRIAYNLRMTQGLHFSVATTARPPSYGVSAHMNLNW